MKKNRFITIITNFLKRSLDIEKLSRSPCSWMFCRILIVASKLEFCHGNKFCQGLSLRGDKVTSFILKKICLANTHVWITMFTYQLIFQVKMTSYEKVTKVTHPHKYFTWTIFTRWCSVSTSKEDWEYALNIKISNILWKDIFSKKHSEESDAVLQDRKYFAISSGLLVF